MKKLLSILLALLMVLTIGTINIFAEDDWTDATVTGDKITISPSATGGAYTKSFNKTTIDSETNKVSVVVDLNSDYKLGDLFCLSLGLNGEDNNYSTEFVVMTQKVESGFLLTAGVAGNNSITISNPGFYEYNWEISKKESGTNFIFYVKDSKGDIIGNNLVFDHEAHNDNLNNSTSLRYLWAFGRKYAGGDLKLDRDLVIYKSFEAVALAKVDSAYYFSIQEAINEGNGKTITLLKDCVVTSQIEIDGDITLNLNNHKISGDKARAIHVNKGSLNLTGKGIVTSDVANVASSVIRVGGNEQNAVATLVVGKDVEINAPTAYGITVFGNTKETVIIEGRVISTAPENNAYDGCAISTLGDDTTPSEIIINSTAYLSATNTNAIYMPSGNLTVNGGEISGLTGIYVKSGKTQIFDGNIIGTGNKKEYNYYGNGGISTGDAVVVDNCGYPNGEPNVVISGGTYSSTNGKTVASYAVEGKTPIQKFVSGGTFKQKAPDNEYIIDGKYALLTNPSIYQVLDDPDEAKVLSEYNTIELGNDIGLSNMSMMNFVFTKNNEPLEHNYVEFVVVKGVSLKVTDKGYLDFTGNPGLSIVTAKCGSKITEEAYVYIAESSEDNDKNVSSDSNGSTNSTLNNESSKVVQSIINNSTIEENSSFTLLDGVDYTQLKTDILNGSKVETVLSSTKINTISDSTKSLALNAAESNIGGGAKISTAFDIKVKLVVDGQEKANITSLGNKLSISIDLPDEVKNVPSGYTR